MAGCGARIIPSEMPISEYSRRGWRLRFLARCANSFVDYFEFVARQGHNGTVAATEDNAASRSRAVVRVISPAILRVFHGMELDRKILDVRLSGALVIPITELYRVRVGSGFENDVIFLDQAFIDIGR